MNLFYSEGLLGQWCKQITQCDTLLQLRYESWSFMRKNGMFMYGVRHASSELVRCLHYPCRNSSAIALFLSELVCNCIPDLNCTIFAGFLEAIKILDRLSSLRLNLPADIALKIFYVPQDIENPIY